MLSSSEFIRQSLDTHLFFARIMKEHSFFLQLGFTPRDSNYSQLGDHIRMEFDNLLWNAVRLSNGVVSREVIESGEIVTQYTMRAEEVSSYYTGVNIPVHITQEELQLVGGGSRIYNARLEEAVYSLNHSAVGLIEQIINFKSNILSNVLSCCMFTSTYPSMIEHILKEAELYLRMITTLQRREEIDVEKEAYTQEVFWNKAMSQHSKFVRGLLDPSEDALIDLANNFANEFDELTEMARKALDNSLPINEVTDESLEATKKIQQFNTQSTKGLIDCNIKSIIIPLLGDHVLRESNHFIRLLKKYQNQN